MFCFLKTTMMKKLILHSFLFFSIGLFAQVGINTTTPQAQLEIKSSNEATPSNTDGILIPKIDTFPATNPTLAQQGMLVYLTIPVGTNLPGFYYWDDATSSWINLKGADGGTLDQAYDFGGAGLGRTVTADNGAVLINGTDGLVSTGTLGSGALAPSGAGTRMVWNPRKAAFRAGETTGAQWNDVNIGVISTAFGFNAIASGNFSTAFGGNTIASGATSTAFGSTTIASGFRSTVFGYENTSSSHGETVIGIGATTYTPSTNGDTQFRTANSTDRLFVVGNAIDVNNNSTVDVAERSDAMVVLKNGLTRLPSTTNTMIDAADGKAVVTKEYLQNNSSGTLDQAYDFGGAGNGRTIIADTGAVTITGTDGFVSTGTIGSGAIAPSGDGIRMVWNPRKAAFRAGNVNTINWDDANIGTSSVALGNNPRASGSASVAIGNVVTASGIGSSAFGTSSSAIGQASTVFGRNNIAFASESTAFGFNNSASSYGETVIGIGATNYTPSINGALQFRTANETDRLFVIGNAIDANNNNTVDVAERSDAMVVLKNGNVGVGLSTPQNRLHFHNPTGIQTFIQLTNSSTGITQNDGMILGNIIGTSEAGIINQEPTNFYLGTSSDQNQLVLTPSGNVGVGTDSAQAKLHVEGNIRMVDGNQAAGRVLTSDANGTATWTTPGVGTAGTLDQSYDFGGAGLGRTITADAGAVTINGTDGFVSTGTDGIGALVPSGLGTRMVWNPRKVAFRAGRAIGTEWDDASIGRYSVAFGYKSTASGLYSTAFGGFSTASGQFSTAFGNNALASGYASTAIGELATASGTYSRCFGWSSLASGTISTAFGASTIASGYISFVSGNGNSAPSYGETVIGIGATIYTPSVNGAQLFRIANETDRLFVIGNAIDTNNNSMLEDSERSNAMVVLKSGNTGIGISSPLERLQVGIGNIAVTQGDIYLAALNGIFNAGGGLMTNAINYIGDAFVPPTIVAGDEDLYIADDIELGGQGYKPGGGTWVAPSDRRLKQNIQSYSDGLESVLRINPVTYQYNSVYKTLDTGETYVGVIAQEVQEVAPYMINEKPFGQVVEEDENGQERIVKQGTNYLTFDSSALTYMLINAVKEINGKYEELRTKNETLENKINELLSKMEMLEKKYFLNDGK